jgi:hypothetical protein
MWDMRVVEKTEECVGSLLFQFACLFCNIEDSFSWAFTIVYAPNSDCDRKFLWEDLARLISWWNMLWCIGGDFNVT